MDGDEVTPIFNAIESRNLPLLRFLVEIEGGELLNFVGPRGTTVLHWAALFAEVPIIELLLKHVKPEMLKMTDSYGRTPSDCTVNGEVRQMLLAAEAATSENIA